MSFAYAYVASNTSLFVSVMSNQQQDQRGLAERIDEIVFGQTNTKKVLLRSNTKKAWVPYDRSASATDYRRYKVTRLRDPIPTATIKKNTEVSETRKYSGRHNYTQM